MRIASINRTTSETDIALTLNINGVGKSIISTDCGFINHMLSLFARHGRYDLDLSCAGDTKVDFHHTVEDIGICLGDAFATALGDKRGILRYGSCILPMDEALILTAVDISGRSLLCSDLSFPSQKIGEFDTELINEFFAAFARHANLTLHIKQLAGTNSHHIAEGAFKSFARSLKIACSFDNEFSDEIPSTKGVL